jgi:hypothetical protein
MEIKLHSGLVLQLKICTIRRVTGLRRGSKMLSSGVQDNKRSISLFLFSDPCKAGISRGTRYPHNSCSSQI